MEKIGDSLYLEPGEVEALAEAARRAAEKPGPPHPRYLLLRALASELEALAERPDGIVLTSATRRHARTAAWRYLREPSDRGFPWATAGFWLAVASLRLLAAGHRCLPFLVHGW